MSKIIKYYGKDAVGFRENTICITIPFNWVNAVGNKLDNAAINITNDTSIIENYLDGQLNRYTHDFFNY